MSYAQKVIEWSVPLSQVQNVPVGYEAQFASDIFFKTILYRISTFEEVKHVPLGIFYYSLDNGNHWLNFPLGEAGMIFTTPYLMRLVINAANDNFLFAEKYGKVYRIRSDGQAIIDSYTIDSFNSSGFEIDSKNNSLYISGQNQTAYCLRGDDFEPDNSLNLLSDPLGISVNGSRNLIWQVDRTKVSLKNLRGEIIFYNDLPEEIDVDYSSSSSSSTSSSSSSSSTSSSSSSSSSMGYSSSSSSSSTSSSSSSSSSMGYSSSSSFSTSSSSSSSSSMGYSSSSSFSTSSSSSSSSSVGYSSSSSFSTSSSSSSSSSVGYSSSSSYSTSSSSSSSSSVGISSSSSSLSTFSSSSSSSSL